MNDRINLNYFAYGNRDYPFLNQNSKLLQPSVCVKSSGANLIQRNYLNFEPGILNTYKPKNLKKINRSRSELNIGLKDTIYNKYHPEYKLYHNTNEQIIDLNNYLNPIKQFLYKDNPKINTTENHLSFQKYKNIYNNRYKENCNTNSIEIDKDKIILKNPSNDNILIPNNFRMKNNNNIINLGRNNKKRVELDSFMESRDSPEYLRSYDKEALKNLDNYYINKKENLHVLSRFGNWITLRPNDKNRSHALEKLKYGVYETSIVAPIWMDISSRRKINKNYESAKRIFKSLQIKNPRDNTKVTALFDRDQKNVKPLFLLDSYEKNRILLNSKEN